LKKKLFVYISIILKSVASLFAFEQVPTATLLEAYLENNSELKSLTISAKSAQLNQQSTKIDNGFSIDLSTGTMVLKVSQDGSSFSVKPNVKAVIPQASNLTFSASSDIYFSSNSENPLEDTSLNVSVDIISSANLERKIKLMKAERTLKEAERKLKKQALVTETEFYSELKDLLSSIASLITTKSDYYSHKIEFEQIKAKGYTSVSSTYILAEMKVVSDEHQIDTKQRNLIHDFVVFYKKCDRDIQIQENEDLITYLPSDIPVVQPVNILDFESEKYSEIESAVWTQKINELTRKTDKKLTLAANGGYTFNNSSTNSDSIDGGISSKIGGVNVSAGVSVPVSGTEGVPAYSLGASLNPSVFKKNQISEQQKQRDIQKELLSLEDAKSDYETLIVDKQQSLNTILWEKKSCEESYVMYEKLARDFENYYQMGVVSESEYLTSQTNEISYKVKLVMNQIDLIMYNNNILALSVEE